MLFSLGVLEKLLKTDRAKTITRMVLDGEVVAGSADVDVLGQGVDMPRLRLEVSLDEAPSALGSTEITAERRLWTEPEDPCVEVGGQPQADPDIDIHVDHSGLFAARVIYVIEWEDATQADHTLRLASKKIKASGLI